VLAIICLKLCSSAYSWHAQASISKMESYNSRALSLSLFEHRNELGLIGPSWAMTLSKFLNRTSRKLPSQQHTNSRSFE
jgi:hypothetical protein